MPPDHSHGEQFPGSRSGARGEKKRTSERISRQLLRISTAAPPTELGVSALKLGELISIA